MTNALDEVESLSLKEIQRRKDTRSILGWVDAGVQLVSLKHKVCEKALSRSRCVLRIDLDSDPGEDRSFIPEEGSVIFTHVACFSDPPSGIIRARADHDGLDADKRNPGGTVHRARWSGRIPDVGNRFSVGEGKKDLGGLVIGV